MSNTIVAIATAMGSGAISIIRLSGKDSLAIASKVFSAKDLNYSSITPRLMYLGKFCCGDVVDKCFMVYFKSPQSYSGEDMIEFHVHGGAKLATALLSALQSQGATLATRGEFTRRAFVNGKVTLSQAEGIADMINAESNSAINCAYMLLSGKINQQIADIESKILDTIAQYEAAFDYPEELEDEARENAYLTLSDAKIALTTLNQSYSRGKLIRNGINVAILGLPNSGKSSLLNALTQSDRAIVADIPGTTRDSIEAAAEHKGILLNFIDTAGLRDSKDPIESQGIARARNIGASADIIIIVLDGSHGISPDEESLINEYPDKPKIIVSNKCDINRKNDSYMPISARTGEGIIQLLDAIVDTFMQETIDSNSATITNLRHKELISQALEIISQALENLDCLPVECIIIDLNRAYTALGEISGNTCREDVIDRIFQRFCLGK